MPRALRLVLLGLLVAAAPAWAAEWPGSRPVACIVPFPAGGSADILARLLSVAFPEELGARIVIDNRSGAGSNLGTAIAAQAAPDGYTILMASVANAINETLYQNLAFKLRRDFVPVALVATLPNVMVVHPTVPARDVREFVALAKARPGALNFGSGGSGTSPHLSAELFKAMAGIDIVHVPYRGSAPALQALIANDVQVVFDNLPSAMPQIRSGTIRALAVTTPERSASLPEVPTIAESGLPAYAAGAWFGLLAPTGTPPEIVERLAGAVDRALAKPAMRERLAQLGATPGGGGPAPFARFIDDEIAKWAEVVRVSGAKVD
jgi:tripartite-type tricarboxylate transporter receptor subunit TctC